MVCGERMQQQIQGQCLLHADVVPMSRAPVVAVDSQASDMAQQHRHSRRSELVGMSLSLLASQNRHWMKADVCTGSLFSCICRMHSNSAVAVHQAT